MIRIILSLIIVCCFSSCVDSINGDGNLTTQSRDLDKFESLELSGMFEVVLEKGKPHITIETDSNLLEHIYSTVESGRLEISTRNKMLNAEKLLVTVYYRDLEAISVSGAVEIENDGILRAKELHLDISGAADGSLNIDVKRFILDLSGGADLELTGVATSAFYELSGAASIDALDLKCDEAEVDATGASELKLNVKNRLNVDISGAGEVKYIGDPEVSQDISGVGELKKMEE